MIALHIDQHVQYPEKCPLAVHDNGAICGHPKLVGTSKRLYCGYKNLPGDWQDAPSLCPLINHPIDGITLEAKLI